MGSPLRPTGPGAAPSPAGQQEATREFERQIQNLALDRLEQIEQELQVPVSSAQRKISLPESASEGLERGAVEVDVQGALRAIRLEKELCRWFDQLDRWAGAHPAHRSLVGHWKEQARKQQAREHPEPGTAWLDLQIPVELNLPRTLFPVSLVRRLDDVPLRDLERHTAAPVRDLPSWEPPSSRLVQMLGRRAERFGLSGEGDEHPEEFVAQLDGKIREVVQPLSPAERSGALSFAALWYADRLGGAALQAQREPSQAGNERIDPMLASAVDFLKEEESAPLLYVRQALEQAREHVQRGEAVAQVLRAGMPRDCFQRPEGWPEKASRQIKDFVRTLDQITSRTTVDWGQVPPNAPIPFSFRTGDGPRHRIYAELLPPLPEQAGPAGRLRIWNAGWGAMQASGRPGRIWPYFELRFSTEQGLTRALLWLRWLEVLPSVPDFWRDHLLALTFEDPQKALARPQNPPKEWSTASDGDRLVLNATQTGGLHVPEGETAPIKDQRSGSCVAKGLRVWLQDLLLTYRVPKTVSVRNNAGEFEERTEMVALPEQERQELNRAGIALLDSVAAAMLGDPALEMGAKAEIRRIRRELAAMTSSYRMAKALSRVAIDELEVALRRASAIRLAGVAPIGEIQLQTRELMLAAPEALAVPPSSPQRSSGEAQEFFSWGAKPAAPPPTPEQEIKRLEELLRDLKLDFRLSSPTSALEIALRTGDAAVNCTELHLDLLFELHRALMVLKVIQQVNEPKGVEPQVAQEIIILALRSLKALVQLLPRRGAPTGAWAAVDSLWDDLPLIGDACAQWDRDPSIEGLGELQLQMWLELHHRLKEWIENSELTGHVQSKHLSRPSDVVQAKIAVRGLIDDVSTGLEDLDPNHPNNRGIAQWRRLDQEVNLCSRNLDFALQSFPRYRFQHRVESWNAEERGMFLLEGRWKRFEAAAYAMESPGVQLLLRRSLEQGQPFAAFGALLRWTTPLASNATHPRPIGDLLLMGGADGWLSWFKGLREQLRIGKTTPHDLDRLLSELTEGLLAGASEALAPDHRQVFQAMVAWYQELIAQGVNLLDPLIATQMRLRDENNRAAPTVEELFGKIPVGQGPSPFFQIVPVPPLALKAWNRWGRLREEQGIADPWQVQIDQHRYDLHTGKPTDSVPPAPAELRLARLPEAVLPPGLKKGIDPATLRPILEAQPGYEPWLRVRGEGESFLVEWRSPFSPDLVRGHLVSLDSSGRSDLLPDFSPEASSFPLSKQTLLLSGMPAPQSLPEAQALAAPLAGARSQAPGIFQTAKIVEWDEARKIWFWSTVREGTLQQTARLERGEQRNAVQFPDGERILLSHQHLLGSLSAIGTESRVLLEDLHRDGEPIRGRILPGAAAAAPTLELDNGWQVRPELRSRLPAWLARLPYGDERGEGIVMPLQRGQELGLLVAAPVQANTPGAGRALFFSVLPSGDLIPDPQTSASALVAALPHVAARAPLLAQRMLQWLIATSPQLNRSLSETMEQTLTALRTESGQLIEPWVRTLRVDQSGAIVAPERRKLLSGRGDLRISIEHEADLQRGPGIEKVKRPALDPIPSPLTSGQALEVAGRYCDMASADVRTVEEGLRKGVDQFPPAQRAILLATTHDLLLPTLLQAWFSTMQSGEMSAWRALFPALDQKHIDWLNGQLSRLAEALVSEGAARQALASAQDYAQAVEAERGAASASALASAEAQALAGLQACRAHLLGEVPPALWRKEFLEYRMARPAQLEALRSALDAVQMGTTGEPINQATLLVVPMGGGKTSLLNPTMALEWATARKGQAGRSGPVFLVVPDNLEEDVRQLCLRQAWGVLLQGVLPFAGTGKSAQQVLAMSRNAASQGLPLTLTQTAWNFAWLELLREYEGGPKPRSRDPVRTLQDDLRWMASASLIIDEADEALALEQSYNLQLAGSRPLPGPLLEAVDRWASFQHQKTQPLLHPLTLEQQRDLLGECVRDALGNLPEQQRRDVVELLLGQFKERPAEVEKILADTAGIEPSALEPVLYLAQLLTEALPTAAQLHYREDYGPANRSGLETVPYRYADWPSDQKFSDPVLLAVLTLAQAANPETWTLERAASLSSHLTDQISRDPLLRASLEQIGLSLDVAQNPDDLHRLLVDPQKGAGLREAMGLLLCQSLAKTAADSISLSATGAALRGQRCVAVTGTAPSPSRLPTNLVGPADAGVARALQAGVLAYATCSRWELQGSAIERLHALVESRAPDIVIDPNGLLRADEARKLVGQMAERQSAAAQRPVALTWSAGTPKSAPALEQILPGGVACAPPAQEALELCAKCAVYQQAQCRGTDLKPRQGERGLILLESVLPLRDLQQAAARLRGLVPDRRGHALQTLEIVLGPEVQREVDALKNALKNREPNLTDLEALVRLAAALDESSDRASLPELLEQELTNLYQAGGVLAIQQGERVQALINSLKSGYRLPSLGEMAARANGTASQKERLRSRGKELVKLLKVPIRELEDEKKPFQNQQDQQLLKQTEQKQQAWQQLLTQAERWQQRLEGWQERGGEGLRPIVKTAVVCEVQQEVAQETEAQRLVQAQREVPQSHEDLIDAVMQTRARLTDDLRLEGVLDGPIGLDQEQIGVAGFRQTWDQLHGNPDERVLEGWSYSPAALVPFGVPLNLDSPLRLEPLVLHIYKNDCWERHLISPQEAFDLRKHAAEVWGRAAKDGQLLLCELSGERLSGIFGPEELPDSVDKADWKKHLTVTTQSLRKLRALYGTPFPPPVLALEDQRADQRWLEQHPAWRQVWLNASPDELRGNRTSQMLSRARDVPRAKE